MATVMYAINTTSLLALYSTSATIVALALAINDKLLLLYYYSTIALKLITKHLSYIKSLVEDYLIKEEEE